MKFKEAKFQMSSPECLERRADGRPDLEVAAEAQGAKRCLLEKHAFFRFLFPVFLGSRSAGVLCHKFHVTTGLRGEGDLKALMKPPDPRHIHAIICIDLIDASVTIPKLSMIAV